ncbi:hypothetical protein B0H34DRAFT_371312 [Crassisporium funariophilum]|nr:hypothetical protein B0H34DRAFT_371312 [Crassisporium funariophilum]
MNTLQGASYAGLAFLCWEILITFQDEIDLMWAQPRKLTIVKLLYFFVRYFALGIQINNSVVSGILITRYPVHERICRLWLTYQVLTVYSLLGAVDLILMIRVYAFYNRKRWIGVLMIVLLFFRVGLSCASAAMTVPTQGFNDACLNDIVPSVVMYCFIVGEFMMQSIILGLTFFKQFIAFRAGWARTPLVALLCRDGATTFTIIMSVLIGTMVYARFGYLHESAHIVFPSFVSVMSCVGCRLIISMQKLVRPEEPQSSFDPDDSHEFTTIIESLWTRTPSARTGLTLSARTPSAVSS